MRSQRLDQSYSCDLKNETGSKPFLCARVIGRLRSNLETRGNFVANDEHSSSSFDDFPDFAKINQN
jgi:hypothetical protein